MILIIGLILIYLIYKMGLFKLIGSIIKIIFLPLSALTNAMANKSSDLSNKVEDKFK